MKDVPKNMVERLFVVGCIDQEKIYDTLTLLEEIDNPFSKTVRDQKFSLKEMLEVI